MNTAEQMVERDRRRAILVVLVMAPAYMMPARGLREQIGLVGYTVSLDRVATDCAWLAEQGLVEWKNDVATLTDRGSDVATGRAQVPGVKRPEPGQL
ncbi:hypothetical protein SAMN05421829_108148 [Aromatoleum tolulyticum]|uniref:Uncharacterized protein n=1 Tax=Aromatoleum tolulyticum TaxID=34027 RepID=A0A1N6X0V1_9RHOO|nr:hypothetical protein [Aromatoleum tolulyticum]SIQ95947.1 hypothetical protein SAMN05421829_108148 [Aromatoleum tolulyticum]